MRENCTCDITYRDVTKPFYDCVKGCDDLTKKLYFYRSSSVALVAQEYIPGGEDTLLTVNACSDANSRVRTILFFECNHRLGKSSFYLRSPEMLRYDLALVRSYRRYPSDGD